MKTVNMHEAKTHLSRMVREVAAGESIIIGKAGVPVAILSPYELPATARKPGAMKGRIRIHEDFDDDVELADLFERQGVE